ncbi:hypothetical protein BpHYR1_004612 [Brachionus plicatilis]|uniref:Uncharacterized protein n=1 Tax=Brachionus plicatilis TaxID=10195 RepID=A0A3M7P6A2_BRAPC|nr:hypothetical protein BpHYR1_004612 [Brachionus plicatilis]
MQIILKDRLDFKLSPILRDDLVKIYFASKLLSDIPLMNKQNIRLFLNSESILIIFGPSKLSTS